MASNWMRALPRLAGLWLAAAPTSPALAAGGAVTGQVIVEPARYQDETVVYLKGVAEAPAHATHEMDQRRMKFQPAVLAIAAGDTVTFLNHDAADHNVHSPDGEAFNLGTFGTGESRSYTFQAEGAYGVHCSIHPEMQGWIFVAPSRYAAVVDRKGRFSIGDVPPGTYHLAVWNAALKGPERTITVAEGRTLEETITIRR